MGETDPLLTRSAVVDTVKSKWWIIPLVVGISVAILFAQESNLDSEPVSATVTRRYEAREAYSALSALEIDAQAFAPMLSVGGQIAFFNSEEERIRRSEEYGFDARLTVTQAPGDFTAVNQEFTDRRTVYSVIAVGSNLYTMTCQESTIAACAQALDVGKTEFETARSQAIVESIGNVAAVLQARLDSVRRSIDSTSDATALLAQRQLEIALSSQVEALGTATNESVYSLALIDEVQTEPSATVSSVSTSTYMLGIIIGLVIALIIILQFAVLRSRRR
jgi:hypothetical protein